MSIIREDNYLLFYVQLRAVTPQNKAEQKVSINKTSRVCMNALLIMDSY